MNYSTQIIITSIILASTIFIFEVSNLDIAIQDYFYNFYTNEWLIDRNNKILRFFFYDGIKKLLILFLTFILISLVFFSKEAIIQKYQKGLFIILLSGILIPSSVGILKKFTKVPCPRNITEYDGEHPYVKVFQKYPKNFHIKKRIKCWPAGHATSGFALMSLFFFFKRLRNKIISLMFAIFVGWIIGIYKMLIGDHFFSHTIITMLISWLIILIIASIIKKYNFLRKN